MPYKNSTQSFIGKPEFDTAKDSILIQLLEDKLTLLGEAKSICKTTLRLAADCVWAERNGSPPLVYDAVPDETDERLEEIANAIRESIKCAETEGADVTCEKLLSAIYELQATTTSVTDSAPVVPINNKEAIMKDDESIKKQMQLKAKQTFNPEPLDIPKIKAKN